MESLRISVVTPSYNQGRFLEDTIRSVIEQHYANLEFIVIDGGSKDESLDIIRKYESKIDYWISETDLGQSDAINKGMQRATGDIITWLCSDDLLTPGALSKVATTFEALPESIGLIHGISELFRDNSTIRLERCYPDLSTERMLAGMAFPQPSSFFRKKLLDETGMLDADLHYGMDYDLFSRMALVTDNRFVDYCFSRYRIHDASKTSTQLSLFLQDWAGVFSSIAAGIELVGFEDVFKILDLPTRLIGSRVEFFRKHASSRSIDRDKLLYYFITYSLRYNYETLEIDKAAKAARYLRHRFRDLLESEPEINRIASRAERLPGWIIRTGRAVSRWRLRE